MLGGKIPVYVGEELSEAYMLPTSETCALLFDLLTSKVSPLSITTAVDELINHSASRTVRWVDDPGHKTGGPGWTLLHPVCKLG